MKHALSRPDYLIPVLFPRLVTLTSRQAFHAGDEAPSSASEIRFCFPQKCSPKKHQPSPPHIAIPHSSPGGDKPKHSHQQVPPPHPYALVQYVRLYTVLALHELERFEEPAP